MTDIMIFEKEEFGQVRTFEIDGEPWFVGKDVADALGYVDANRAVLKFVDEEDRETLSIKAYGNLYGSLWDNKNDFSNKTIINESGLYSLIFSSKLEQAKAFKRWVTSEVLPTIRKTGSYTVTKIDSKENDDIDDKLKIAQSIIDCPNEKLSYILKLFNIEEIPVPIQEKPYFRYGERLDRFNTVKELMIEKGVRPAEFAKMMGYPKSTMHNYMHNYSVPSLQRCDDMIQTLNDLK